ncbi:MAG: substrate-binding domain-containing protein [Fimbriimonadales bacterium]
MRRVARVCWLLVLSGFLACDSRPPAPAREQFQFPMAVFVESSPHPYWEAVERGLKSRLSEPGMSVEWQFFNAQTRQTLVDKTRQTEYRAVALTAVPTDSWAQDWIQTLVQEAGTPVVLMGADIPESLRLGYVGTYYYDVGRRVGAWFARKVPRGEVWVIANHPVPRAVSEFWDGFRHGLLNNRRLRPQLIGIDRRSEIPSRVQTLAQRPSPAGIFFMGHDVAQVGLSTFRSPTKGVLSWNNDALNWYRTKQCQLLVVEQPEEVGLRTGNILRNLSQGRGRTLTIVFVPCKWYTR